MAQGSDPLSIRQQSHYIDGHHNYVLTGKREIVHKMSKKIK